jgi:aryl-alcohol dehydrogenase-like predicted oxidoreductase
MFKQALSGVSRRAFLEAGVLAGVGTLLTNPSAAAESTAAQPLITKVIPSSGERIPAIGIGTDSFREDLLNEIRAELQRMSELGGSVIDTAAAYGDSEALIGDALVSLNSRDKMFLATKLVGSGSNSSAGASGAASFDRSLERLKTRRVDLLQVHNLNGVAQLIPLMQQWKKDGAIRYIGVTTSRTSQHAELIDVMRHYPLDFIQVDYSIADRDAAETILPLALERKLAVLVNLPFGRSSLFQQASGRALPPSAADIDVASWAQYFLKYVIAHPAVTCAIPGSTKLSHLVDNQGAGRGRLPDPAMRRKMEGYWDGWS